MPIINRIAEFPDDMTAWRRDLHRHPETAFEERRTADLVAEKLAEWVIEVHRGLAATAGGLFQWWWNLGEVGVVLKVAWEISD